MTKHLDTALLVGIVCFLLASPCYGQRKLAQTGMKFLSVGTDARAMAVGEAVTAVEGYSSSMFFNPAGMSRLGSLMNFSVGMTQWIADINYYFGSFALSPRRGQYGVFGVTVLVVNYGGADDKYFFPTIRANNEQGFIDLDKNVFKPPTASAIGVGYARALTDRFSVGGHVRYVTQNLGSATLAPDIIQKYSKSVLAYDFGILYKTGFRSLNFGMTVRNFSREIRYERESFQLPLIFKMGLSMNVLDVFVENQRDHALLLSVDATHPRDYPEQINVGGEYVFLKTLALRGGYMFNNDEYGLTAGFGLHRHFGQSHLAIDYSYTPFGVFNSVHRFTFQFSL